MWRLPGPIDLAPRSRARALAHHNGKTRGAPSHQINLPALKIGKADEAGAGSPAAMGHLIEA